MAEQDINHRSTQETPGRQYLVQLRQALETRFSEQELRTLCFDLGIEYKDLPFDTRPASIEVGGPSTGYANAAAVTLTPAGAGPP